MPLTSASSVNRLQPEPDQVGRTKALVGRTASIVDDAGAKLGRYVESRFPDGVRVERSILSSEEFH